MNGIIVGAGRIGLNLARNMVEKHDITLIEKDRQICENVRELLDCYVIQGTATNIQVLEEADINKADFFVAATPNDEVNLLSSVYAKDNGVKTIVSRLNNIEHLTIFKKLHIQTINPESSAMRYIARNIVRPTAQRLVSLGKGDAEIIELIVKNNNLIFTPIKDIEANSDKFKIITVYSDDEEIIPTPETELGYDDSIVVLVKREYIHEIRQLFTQEEVE